PRRPSSRGRRSPTPAPLSRSAAAPYRAARRGARPGWRSPPRLRRRAARSGAAERLELVGQRLPLVSPSPLLLALLGDHLARRPRDEVLVRELRLEPGERSEEHTSELQSRGHLVCRLLLEKKKDVIRRID